MRVLDLLVFAGCLIATTLWLVAAMFSPGQSRSQAAKPYAGPDIVIANG